MKKNINWFIVLSLVMLSSVSCYKNNAHSNTDLIQVTLKLKWKHQFQFAGYYAALEKGFYEDAGFYVTIIESSTNTEATQDVLNGDVDFGVGASDLLITRSEGNPIVLLASLFQHSPLVFLVREDSGIGHVHDLVGKRVMLEPYADELIAYLHDEGISPDQFILFPHTHDISPLINEEVDAMSAYITDEPFLLEEAGIDYIIISPRLGGIDFYGDILFTSEDFLHENPEVVQAFIEASKRGWDYAFNNTNEVINIILSSYSSRHSRAHLEYEAEKMHQLVIPEIVEFGYMNPGRWDQIIATYSRLGMLQNDLNLNDFIYSENTHKPNLLLIVPVGIYVILAISVLIGLSQVFTTFSQRILGTYQKKQC